MPRYVYRCTECEELVVIQHSSTEVETGCPKCSDPHGLVKVITPITTRGKKSSTSPTVGDVTEEHIRNAREHLEEQRKDPLVIEDYK